MATVHVVLAGAANRSRNNTQQPVIDAIPIDADTITSSSTSQQADITTDDDTGGAGLYWQITVSGGDVWAKFGSNPTAATGEDFLILDGQTREFSASLAQKVAIIDV